MIKSFAKIFIVIDLCIILYASIFETSYWLLNTQVAFLSSIFITIASFLSYKRNINGRLKNFDSTVQTKLEDRDKVDEIDDPFDLYSEDIEPIPEEELTPQKIKEIIQDEKNKVKKNSFKNTIFSAGGFLSVYRVIGYGVLIFGFFALNNNNLFLPIPFMIGLGVVPIGALFTKSILKLGEDQ